MIKNKNDVKLYNVVPIAFLPLIIGGLILGNFIIDSIVLLVCLKIFYDKVDFQTYLKNIFFVVFFGFIGNTLGSIFLILLCYTDIIDVFEFSLPLILFTICAVILSAAIIFWLNYSFGFRKTDFTKKQKLYVSFMMAISTAPFTFFIPSTYFYYLLF